jgi:glutathione S-transferase
MTSPTMTPRDSPDFHFNPERPVTLYNFAMSPFGIKVHAFLLFKRLNFHVNYPNPITFKKEVPTGRQLPVVQVGTESRADSTPIGLWLDEVFPHQPLLLPVDENERERLLAIDDWVTRRLIPITFRIPQEPGLNFSRIRNGWRLAHVMNQTCNGGLPRWLELAWPLIVGTQPFVKNMLAMAEPDRPIAAVKNTMYKEFLEHLDGGPFLGGRATPSLPDLAAYPQILIPGMVGMDEADYFFEYPKLVEWLACVRPWVVGNPPLMRPNLCINTIEQLPENRRAR